MGPEAKKSRQEEENEREKKQEGKEKEAQKEKNSRTTMMSVFGIPNKIGKKYGALFLGFFCVYFEQKGGSLGTADKERKTKKKEKRKEKKE